MLASAGIQTLAASDRGSSRLGSNRRRPPRSDVEDREFSATLCFSVALGLAQGVATRTHTPRSSSTQNALALSARHGNAWKTGGQCLFDSVS